jgi:hypothetical protein
MSGGEALDSMHIGEVPDVLLLQCLTKYQDNTSPFLLSHKPVTIFHVHLRKSHKSVSHRFDLWRSQDAASPFPDGTCSSSTYSRIASLLHLDIG